MRYKIHLTVCGTDLELNKQHSRAGPVARGLAYPMEDHGFNSGTEKTNSTQKVLLPSRKARLSVVIS